LFDADWKDGTKYEGNDKLIKKKYLASKTYNFDQNTIGEFEIETMNKLRKSLIE
jgi:hypothetical protein